MRVLSKLTMLVLSGLLLGACDTGAAPELPPAVGRPEGTSQGPRAAVVVAVRGTAEIQPSQGLAFPARPEQQLLRDDRIVTAEGSLVVVALHNQHVVRLSPGTLRVDMLAAFNERPAGDDLERRFDELLTPDERQDPALRGAIARVAGWNTRMTAAETIAPQQTPPQQQDRPEKALEGGPDSKPADAPAEAAEKQPLSDRPTDADGGFGGSRQPEGAPSTEAKRPTTGPPVTHKPPPPSIPPAPSAEPERDDLESSAPSGKKSEKPTNTGARALPDFISFQPDGGGKPLRVSLPAPLVAVRASLAACAGADAKIRAHIVDKKISELRINGAASKCEPGLIGKSVGLADGWLELQVQ